MGKVLQIQPVTRIEGHARISVHLNDEGNVEDAYMSLMSLRGFEKFIEGRPAEEVPRIVNRICGICPWMHHTASNKAVDGCFGVTPTPTGHKLREKADECKKGNNISCWFKFFTEDIYGIAECLKGIKADPNRQHDIQRHVVQRDPMFTERGL